MTHTLPMLLAVNQEGGELGPFTVEGGLIFWTWAVFLTLFFLLKKFAYPAIVNATEERERRISDQLEEAERLNTEAKETLEEHRKALAGAKQEAQAIIGEAKTVAQKEREQLLEKTRQEQDQILERAKREISAERDRAMSSLRKEAVDLSLAAAARLVETNLDDEANRKIVVDYLGSIGERN